MVDNNKRHSLKSLGALAALPLVPAAMTPLVSQAGEGAELIAPIDMFSEDQQLSISLQLDGTPVMKVTNTGNTLTIVRRIHPGIVQAGSKVFDLNHALIGSSYAIGAGSSRVIPIMETSSTYAESALPARYKKMPLRSANISASDAHGELLNATRVVFA